MNMGLSPNTGSINLFDTPDVPPIGEAVLDNFNKLYGSNSNPKAAMKTYLLDFMRRPTSFKLPDAGKYKGVPVTWIPGHVIGSGVYGPQKARTAVVGNMVSSAETGMLSLMSSDGGAYLRNTLRAYELDLAGVYATTVSKFSPPYQGISKMPAKWSKECKYFLYQELLNVKPEYVLLMGAEVLKAVMGKGATLKEYRGQQIDIPWLNAKAVVTLSPYAVMRNPEKTEEFQTDIRYFRNLVTGRETADLSKCRYETISDIKRLREVVEYLKGFNVYSVDVETTGLDSMEGEILTVQICPRPGEAYVILFKSLVSGRSFNAPVSRIIQQLSQVLNREGVCIVGHNFKFDIKWLKRVGLDLTSRFFNSGFDTMLASHLLNEVNDHSLSACTIRDTDMGRYDAKMEEYLSQGLEHKDVPDDDLHWYGAADVDAAYRLYEVYRNRLWSYHLSYCEASDTDPYELIMSPDRARACKIVWPNTLWNLFKYIVMPVGDSICEMEMTGFLVDKPLLLDMIRKFADKRDEILRRLRYMLQKPDFNPRSPQQCQEILFDDPAKEDENGCVIGCLGLRPITTTGKRPKQWEEVEDRGEVWYEDGHGWRSNQHAPGTGGEVLAILADEQGSKVASVLKDFRAIDQICKNFLAGAEEDKLTGEMKFKRGLVGMSGSDNRLHTSISQLTDTGRWRSARPNCQNIPKGREGEIAAIFGDQKIPTIRSAMIAKPGHVIVEADFDSAETYTLAYIADDKVMKEDLARVDEDGNKISLHSTTAVSVFKLPYTVPEYDKLRSDYSNPDAKWLNGLRVAAKAINFGIAYGRGGKALAREVMRQGVECKEEDGQGWVDAWYDRYKDCAAYLQFCRDSTADPGYIVTPWGRHRRFIRSNYNDVNAAMERESSNFPIQSTVADAISYAIVKIQRERDLLGLQARLILAVHDAVVMEVPYEEVPIVLQLLQKCMSDDLEVPGTGLHYDIETEIGLNWSDNAPEHILKLCGLGVA